MLAGCGRSQREAADLVAFCERGIWVRAGDCELSGRTEGLTRVWRSWGLAHWQTVTVCLRFCNLAATLVV
jgi:hypothetical protein